MLIRDYKKTDKIEVINLIKDTIQTINLNDYNKEQIAAWSNVDEANWNESLLNHHAIVMVHEDETILGFCDMDATGYIDRLFVHKDFQRMGIAKNLVTKLESDCRVNTYSTYASITAKPFFESMGLSCYE